jgi:probable F420-dependent oxidoreductase
VPVSDSRPTPFRFCVATGGTKTRHEWRELARKAEASGFDTLTMTDHIHQQLAPFTALSMAAAVTTTLRLGTYVMCHDLRNPVILAKEFATLDVLSDGRAEIGLGAGWRESDYTSAGIPFDTRLQRFERFAEYVDIVCGLLSGTTLTYAGRHLSVADVTNVPAQPKPIPLLIGGSRRRLIELAAARADTVSIAPSRHPDGRRSTYWDTEIDDRVRWARVAAAGRPAQPEIDLAVHECHVEADPSATLTRLANTFGLREDDIPKIPSLLIGTPEQIAESLQARRERWGATRVTIPDTALDAMASVVARLCGA